jgi:hypothetical protein
MLLLLATCCARALACLPGFRSLRPAGLRTYHYTNAAAWLPLRYLHGNNLTGGLPPQWAMNGSFTTLKQVTLSDNPLLGGSLPPEWGAADFALPALQDINVSNSGLGGTLPAEWGPGLQSLRFL